MKNKKTIMNSHEVFCDQLIEAVKGYSKDELSEFIETYINRNSYKDYISIYEYELNKR